MRRIALLSGLVFTAALVLPAIATAQITTGTITGEVRDPNGDFLPGVTIVANSPALIQTDLMTVSSANGQYRLNLLPPGVYEVTFQLQGFQPQQRTGVVVRVGQSTILEVRLDLTSVQETMVVTGEVPTIDFRSAKLAFNYSETLAENVPTARNMNALFATIPGVESLNNLGVQQPGVIEVQNVLGAGERSGNYRLDGANTTDPAGQWNAQSLMSYDIVEEVQVVKAAKPAEIPFQGGYFNVISKSGGNSFSGTLAGYFSDDALQGTNVDQEVGETTNELVGEYELTASLGGRIVRDKLWWYGSARLFNGKSNIFQFPAEITEDVKAFSGKLTYQVSRNHRLTALATKWEQEVSHFFFNYSPTLALDEEASSFRPLSGTTAGLRWSGILSENVVAEASFNYTGHSFDQFLQPGGTTAIVDLVTGQRARSQGTSAGAIRDQDNRLLSGTASLSWFVPDAAGPHDIKAGFEYVPTRSELDFGEPNDHQLHTCRGFKCAVRFLNTPTTSIWNNDLTALYAQDSWTIGDRLTLNFGLRYMHTYASTPELHAGGGTYANTPLALRFPELNSTVLPPTDLVTWDTLEPRFAGTYMIGSRGRTVVRFGVARYYHNLASFDMFVLTPAFPVTWVTRWNDANNDFAYQIGEDGPLMFSFGGQLNQVDPDLTRPYTNEFMVGGSHEISGDLQVSANFVYRKDNNLMATVDVGVPFSAYSPVDVVDPGSDGVEGTGDDGTITVYSQDPDTIGDSRLMLTNPESNERWYKGLELSASKRLAENWQAVGSLVWSQMEVLRPTTSLSTTGLYESPNGLINAKGLDPANQTVQLKLQGTYMFNFGLNMSGFYRFRTGNPYTRLLAIEDIPQGTFPQGVFTVRAEERGTTLTDGVHAMDLRFDQTFALGIGTIGVIFDVFNLFNTNATLNEGELTGFNYGDPIALMRPRLARIGVRYMW